MNRFEVSLISTTSMTINKLTFYVSILAIIFFSIPLAEIILADFKDNQSVSKPMAIFYYMIVFVWFILPSITYIFIRKLIKNKSIIIFFFIINSIASIYFLAFLF